MTNSEGFKMLSFESREQEKPEDQAIPKRIMQDMRKDMGKVALLVALLAFVLMVVLFFAIEHKVSSLDSQVSELYGLKGVVSGLQTEVQTTQQKLAEVEGMTQENKLIIYSDILQELSQKTGFLGNQLQGEEREKLRQAGKLLNEVSQGLKE